MVYSAHADIKETLVIHKPCTYSSFILGLVKGCLNALSATFRKPLKASVCLSSRTEHADSNYIFEHVERFPTRRHVEDL